MVDLESAFAPVPDGIRARKKYDTWRALRTAALELIAEKGFDAVSAEDIAQAAGVAPRTFFNYFASKEAVVFDPDPEDPRLWAEILAARPEREPPWDSLREIVVAYCQCTATDLIAHKRMSEASTTLARSSRSKSDAFWAAVRAWLTPRVNDSEPTLLHVSLLIASAQAALRTTMDYWRIDDGPDELYRLLYASFDLLAEGLDS